MGMGPEGGMKGFTKGRPTVGTENWEVALVCRGIDDARWWFSMWMIWSWNNALLQAVFFCAAFEKSRKASTWFSSVEECSTSQQRRWQVLTVSSAIRSPPCTGDFPSWDLGCAMVWISRVPKDPILQARLGGGGTFSRWSLGGKKPGHCGCAPEGSIGTPAPSCLFLITDEPLCSSGCSPPWCLPHHRPQSNWASFRNCKPKYTFPPYKVIYFRYSVIVMASRRTWDIKKYVYISVSKHMNTPMCWNSRNV